ncbi:MAG TPA: hypothetical protein VFH22_09445, partial [Rhodocyclaceae bacterium]|nr:hypothetical protein [Rhodocyclaceae bacterium]
MTQLSPNSDPSPDPRWQPALDLSRFLRQLLAARPALVAALQPSWEQALDRSAMLDYLTNALDAEAADAVASGN